MMFDIGLPINFNMFNITQCVWLIGNVLMGVVE